MTSMRDKMRENLNTKEVIAPSGRVYKPSGEWRFVLIAALVLVVCVLLYQAFMIGSAVRWNAQMVSGAGGAIGLLVGGLLLYFLPGLLAGWRCHRNANAIGALNLFLGWTFIGWVVAMVWALTDNVHQ